MNIDAIAGVALGTWVAQKIVAPRLPRTHVQRLPRAVARPRTLRDSEVVEKLVAIAYERRRRREAP